MLRIYLCDISHMRVATSLSGLLSRQLATCYKQRDRDERCRTGHSQRYEPWCLLAIHFSHKSMVIVSIGAIGQSTPHYRRNGIKNVAKFFFALTKSIPLTLRILPRRSKRLQLHTSLSRGSFGLLHTQRRVAAARPSSLLQHGLVRQC
jgi:hypothetical protein